MILLLEQSFSVSDLRNFQKEYSINLRANEEEYKTGLQLLKKESETKISKRTGAGCRVLLSQRRAERD